MFVCKSGVSYFDSYRKPVPLYSIATELEESIEAFSCPHVSIHMCSSIHNYVHSYTELYRLEEEFSIISIYSSLKNQPSLANQHHAFKTAMAD